MCYLKPPTRIEDHQLLARFRACRPWCQVCGCASALFVHRMGDLHAHAQTDVFDNLMRLCAPCHGTNSNETPRRTANELRTLRERDEASWSHEYSGFEVDYDGKSDWVVLENLEGARR